MAKIKILGQVFSTQYGVLKTGDILTCSDEFAAHLVNDAKAAEFMDAPNPAEPPAAVLAADAPVEDSTPGLITH